MNSRLATIAAWLGIESVPVRFEYGVFWTQKHEELDIKALQHRKMKLTSCKAKEDLNGIRRGVVDHQAALMWFEEERNTKQSKVSEKV